MRDFEDSTLWRISAFERIRAETGGSGFMRLEGRPTLLPTTLQADLQRLEEQRAGDDVLEVVAACIRHREPALLCLQHEQLVWPVTLFPAEGLYHSPRDMSQASRDGMAGLKVITTEPPGVRPPGHWMYERIGSADQYHPLVPWLWAVSLHGPRKTLLTEIGGTAAYRALSRSTEGRPVITGVLGSALERLHRESVSYRDIARWPGMNPERAARLLYALYLSAGLMVTRANAAAKSERSLMGGLFNLGKPKR